MHSCISFKSVFVCVCFSDLKYIVKRFQKKLTQYVARGLAYSEQRQYDFKNFWGIWKTMKYEPLFGDIQALLHRPSHYESEQNAP